MSSQGEDMSGLQIIPPRSGASLELAKGQVLTVIDPEGEQVSDLIAYNAHDIEEYVSSGRSIDYAGRIFLTTGDILYSNRSNPLLRITRDDVGRHDFSLTPCSKEMFQFWAYGGRMLWSTVRTVAGLTKDPLAKGGG